MVVCGNQKFLVVFTYDNTGAGTLGSTLIQIAEKTGGIAECT